MGLFKSLKGTGPNMIGGDDIAQDQQMRSSEKHRLFGHQGSSNEQSAVSSYPSSSMRAAEYEPPPGPPPGYRNEERSESFAPPPGPPPMRETTQENPPPYHDWTAIPDTALLPPPPAMRYEYSTNNASWDDAARAHEWCYQNPLYSPSKPHPSLYNAVRNGDISIQKPAEFKGDVSQLGTGQWKARTKSSCTDCVFLSSLPLYFAAEDSPLVTERPTQIYFEVRVRNMGGDRSPPAGIAIGFCAKPYPSWRLPGWHRASLAVHGDDGRRFVNDSDGGLEFTRPFQPGETIGIGMTFRIPSEANSHGKAQAEVFFTRDGKRDSGWQVDEERDGESDSVLGLEGELDLYAAIGVFGATELEVQFGPEGWLFQP